ncbi:receptor-interacting serine/threonine-protein kinase 3 [Gadus morhua]|uniref:receptor-interacting serine/threonine-protein kinase 3 n=1 Tax=Gadus morhua TaxID=8049 RepID=UPI0011B6795A|nr:receptor-interacting serine/threonine-protein kinase 3-like [Gadus morhua]
MEQNQCHIPVCDEESLVRWEVIGSGGFGQIFKARHVRWAWDVAIKILHYDDGSSSALRREAELMRRGESPFVVRVSGVFQGRLPSGGPSILGLVMDYMEQGSLADLQGVLRGPPPWPLAFRLSYQVALGMNFLHTLSPPMLHMDLKPSNVLLDSGLNVKLTDFGLARISQSMSRKSKVGSAEDGGTTSYMPPEAFGRDYRPSRSSDMYSYGILLWSILTGQKPYKHVISSLVRFRVPEGDRPPLESIDPGQTEGLRPLVDMMAWCWDSVPQQRPSFLDCISVTEQQYDLHKSGITSAIHSTQALLDTNREERKISDGLTELHITQPSSAINVRMDDITGPPPVQETADDLTRKKCGTEKPSSQPMSFSETKLISTSTNTESGSSLNLNHAPNPQPEATARPTAPGSPYQRQFSNPEQRPLSIKNSHVSFFQRGDGNYMHISDELAERRRHPTAPPRFNSTRPNSKGHGAPTGEH